MIPFEEIRDKNVEYPSGSNVISFSQLAIYNKCPKHWKLRYIDGYKEDIKNIYGVYGTVMHEILQTFFYIMYNHSAKEASQMNFTEILQKKLFDEVSKIKDEGIPNSITKEEVVEYYKAGVEILEWFVKRRNKYFSKKGYDLLGIETPLLVDLKNNVKFIGYIDLIIKDKHFGDIILYDIKTSNKGWSKWDKRNIFKYGQLILYKMFYSEIFDVDLDLIEPKYFILKKELKDLSEYGITDKHVQQFSPSHGKIKRKEMKGVIEEFVDECFTKEGKHKTDRGYTAVAGKKGWNCTFCPFKDRQDLCNSKDRVYYE